MPVPLLDVQTGDFDSRNLLLQLALGLIAKGEQLEQLLDLPAPATSTTGRAPTDDDSLAHLVLGLLSVRSRLLQHLERATQASGADTPAQLAEHETPLAEVLR